MNLLLFGFFMAGYLCFYRCGGLRLVKSSTFNSIKRLDMV